MRPKVWAWSLGAAIVLSVLFVVSTPLAAASGGGPILDYLQLVIKPEMDLIQTTVTAIQTTVNATQSTVNQIASNTTPTRSIRFLHSKTTTLPNTYTPIGIESGVVPPIPFGKVCHYSVSLILIQKTPGTWIPGVDSFRLVDGVFDGVGTTADVDVGSFDPAIQKSLIAPSYTGSNSFIAFQRGADGIGAVEVWVNGYLECEP